MRLSLVLASEQRQVALPVGMEEAVLARPVSVKPLVRQHENPSPKPPRRPPRRPGGRASGPHPNTEQDQTNYPFRTWYS